MSPHFRSSDGCVYLDAPLQCHLIEGQRQWFSISRQKDYLCKSIKTSAAIVVSEIVRRTRGDEPVCVIGHSQGGMIAAYLHLKWPDLVKTAICISSEMPFLSEMDPILQTAGNQLLFLHGKNDRFISIDQLEAQLKTARDLNVQANLDVFEGGQHEIEDRYVQRAAEFVSKEGSFQYERA